MSRAWLVDRSRVSSGTDHCQMARYHGYHAEGTGLTLARPALDPWIGIATHDLLSGFVRGAVFAGTWMGSQAGVSAVGDPVPDWNVRLDAITKKRGEGTHTGAEAGHLAYSLAHGWWFIFSGWLDQYDIVAIEQEFELQLDGGRIVLMVKPDLVLRHKETRKLTILDFKTMASFDPITTPAQFRESVQIALMTKAVENALGEPIETFWIAGMVKGSKKHFEKDGMKSEEKRFYSHLCYASEPKAPFGDRWLTKGYWYHKKPVWWNFSPSAWIQQLHTHEPALLAELFPLMGPFQRQTHMIEQAIRFVVGNENRWIERLWAVWTAEASGMIPLEVVLDSLFDRSYGHCTSFYGDICPFMTLCYKLPGHENPTGSGLYVPRRPHHQPEADRFVEDGLVLTSEPWEV